LINIVNEKYLTLLCWLTVAPFPNLALEPHHSALEHIPVQSRKSTVHIIFNNLSTPWVLSVPIMCRSIIRCTSVKCTWNENETLTIIMYDDENKIIESVGTSSLHMRSWAVWADTIMWRAAGVTKPSSTALSMNASSEL